MTRQLHDLNKDLPKEKPTLNEIAAMPFPLSMVATRAFYDKDWHKPAPDGETPCKWKVSITYKTTSEEWFDCEVVAVCEADAIEAGEALFDKSSKYDDEIIETKVECVEGEDNA